MRQALASITALALAASVAAGSVMAAPAASSKNFHKSGISFKYPSKGWKGVPKSEQSSLAAGFASDPKDFKVGGLGGVFEKDGKKAGVAVFVKLTFSSKFRSELKSRESIFFNKIVQSASSGGKHVTKGKAKFAGHKGPWIELTQPGSTPTRDWFAVSLASGDKFGQLGILVTVPATAWSKYSKPLMKIANSVKFK